MQTIVKVRLLWITSKYSQKPTETMIFEILEEIFIKELKPGLNTKEDYRKKELKLKD